MGQKVFVELPEEIQTWFLDTCVWGEVVASKQREEAFVRFFQQHDYVAGLTVYTLFELSRAHRILAELDNLFFILRHNIWVAQMYDSLFEEELASFPRRPRMKWMPISLITGENAPYLAVLTQLANHPLFTKARDAHLDFGRNRFMSLERFKKNFPPLANGRYTPQQAYTFALSNAIDYFMRHEPEILKKIGVDKFKPEGIPSQYARSLFLFYKYYVHGQSPMDSDFMDFAHVSYAPYFDVYVTERNASNVLRRIKATGLLLENVKVLHLTEFLKLLVA